MLKNPWFFAVYKRFEALNNYPRRSSDLLHRPRKRTERKKLAGEAVPFSRLRCEFDQVAQLVLLWLVDDELVIGDTRLARLAVDAMVSLRRADVAVCPLGDVRLAQHHVHREY